MSDINVPKIGKLKALLRLPKLLENPAKYFQAVLKEHDGLVDYNSLLFTDRPDLIRYVFQKNNKNYRKSDNAKKALGKYIGNGLLVSDGEYWLKQRRAIQPGFHKKRLENISKLMVKEINQFMDDVLDVYAEKGEVFDMSDVMTNLAFQVVSKSLFGTEVADEHLAEIDKAVTDIQQYVVDSVRKPFLKPFYYLSGRMGRVDLQKQKSDGVLMQIINERRKNPTETDDLLNMLLEIEYEDGSKMNDTQLLEESIILYVAGHETSALALAWAWYLIAEHPETEQKLLEHTRNVIGDQDPSFMQLRELSYALQVAEETMRLYPPAWFIDRMALGEDNFEGIHIEKDQNVVALVYSMHRNPKYWENPDSFSPERFAPELKTNKNPAYMPFGAGPRLCIGQSFALMEMQLILAMMIKRYKFEVIPNQEIDVKPLITLRSMNGIFMKLHKR